MNLVEKNLKERGLMSGSESGPVVHKTSTPLDGMEKQLQG